MGPLKIISDGSLNTRTARCCEPYAEKAVHGFPLGQPNQTPEELRSLLARARENGLDVAVHAIGDRAVTEALAAFADTGARGGIEHVQLTTRDDVRRMGAPGVRASVQPAHLLDDRDVTERLWPGRAERCFPLRWMLDDGVDVVLGSGRPGLAAGPVAGDRGRCPPRRRRRRGVAPRAVDHRARGARRLDRRLGDGRRRPPRRLRDAVRRPARG
ncbi:amidohydrolase family protein [Nocardioides sp. B-3]|nr:amidohydrolase family protein [Nocardioides sp. B-3]UUZ61320.1 amidohydrolase family protein [Nocardioides sp. B-3]